MTDGSLVRRLGVKERLKEKKEVNKKSKKSGKKGGEESESEESENEEIDRGEVGGSKEGEFRCPSSVAVSCEGEVYVCDMKNHRIQVFA